MATAHTMNQATPHPRLFAGREDLARLRAAPTMPAMIAAHKDLIANADRRLRTTRISGWGAEDDPSGLGMARALIDRCITLAAAWLKTGRQRYRRGALEHIRTLDYQKTVPYREQNKRQGLWLSDGEEAAGIAIVYDWLYDSLSEDERQDLVNRCRKRLFARSLEQCREGGAWWFGKRFSNWNAVCAGGIGMLCLAMYDDCCEAPDVLPHVEQSLTEFITPLKETDGGWPEGLGYWNYGMAYAFQYLMSWERCFSSIHPLMKLSATKKTLSFPFDFYPNQRSAGFGDNNNFHPTPFHYAAAKRFKLDLVMGAIDSHLTATCRGLGGLMGGSATFCVQHPGIVTDKVKTEFQVARTYKGLGWGMIADSMPEPKLYLAMRGGNTNEEHCHIDLLSFRVLVGNEWLIENGRGGEYLHPTYFGRHRAKINDINSTYKNTIFVNGIGMLPGSATDSEQAVRGQNCYGLRMIASSAIAVNKGFCGRLALMVDDAAFVIIDRVRTIDRSRVEARMHSYHDVKTGKTGAMITGASQRLRVSYASLEKARLFTATTAPTTPTQPSATMLRWCPLRLHEDTVLVTLLTPGRSRAAATVTRDGRNFLIRLRIGEKRCDIRVGPSLSLLKPTSNQGEYQ